MKMLYMRTVFLDKVPLCISDEPGTHYLDQDDIQLII